MSTSTRRIQVLDGGMGTTLEALGQDVSTALWGCDLLQTRPEVIEDVHKRFKDAGADIIQTATYQLTLPALCKHTNLDEASASKVMQSAIPLAHSAISSSSGSVGLSIGPFGSTIYPGQEYTGIYPPPYGPTSSTKNYFHDDPSNRAKAVDALTEFHLSRLKTYSEDAEIWSKVSWIVFETIPVLTEYLAIRHAMGQLGKLGRGKKFWIVSAYPNGKHPQMYHGDEHVSVREVLMAALSEHEGLPAANGVGVNCTKPQFISGLAEKFGKTLVEMRKEDKIGKSQVTFVIYPDGGKTYDTVTRTWSAEGLDSQAWGQQVAKIAEEVGNLEQDGQRVWDGVIVGGCCKAGFDEIRALKKSLN